MKKLFVTLIAFAVGMGLLNCVSPFYGTARVEKGWDMDAGLAACTFANTLGTLHYLAGMRGDCEIRYGFNKYLQSSGRIGFGGGYEILDDSQEPERNDLFPLLDGAIGVQGAYPLKAMTPALRVEAGSGVSVMPLVGFGEGEWLTVGSRIWVSYAMEDVMTDVFISAHPLPRLSVFAGVSMLPFFVPTEWKWNRPLASVGIGYKFVR